VIGTVRQSPGSDAIAVLIDDHQRIRQTFEEFEALAPSAYVGKSKVVARMIEEITAHSFIENEVLYPRLRRLLPDLEDKVLSACADHRFAELIAAELWTMRPDDERFTPRTTELIDHLREHLGVEERGWFPLLEGALDSEELDELGISLVRARRRAPAGPLSG
jgi:hemerythrin-like domain-containing protein